MLRPLQGRRETAIAAGKKVRAYVPPPLPPQPALRIDGPIQTLLEFATLAVGRLDAVSNRLPNAALLLDAFVRKEALASSQIEGLQSSLSDLLRFELGETPNARSAMSVRSRAAWQRSIMAGNAWTRASPSPIGWSGRFTQNSSPPDAATP